MKNKLLLLTTILTAGLFLGGCTTNQKQPTADQPTADQKACTPEIIQQALARKRNAPPADYQDVAITIEDQRENFCSGIAGSGPGGGHFFAAKVGGQWEIAWAGNGFVFCQEIEGYNFPNDMISVCIDEETNEEVKR